jgi:hypothetical protein
VIGPQLRKINCILGCVDLVSASLPERKFARLLSDLNRALSVAAVRILFTKHVLFILMHP